MRIGGEGSGSQSQMDYSHVVNPTQAHDYAGYVEGFEGYDRMDEEAMVYRPEEEEASHYIRTEEVSEVEDLEAKDDDGHVHAASSEPEPESGQHCRDEVAPVVPVVGPPFPGGLETTLLLSDYAKHVAIPLWVNDNNVSV